MRIINKDDIEKIKELFEEADIIEDSDMKNLKKLQIESGADRVKLGKLFLICYDYLVNNSYLLSKDKDLNKKLDDYLSDFKRVNLLRNLFEEFRGGKEIGSYFTKEKIKDYINLRRKQMNSLINLFFQLFIEGN